MNGIIGIIGRVQPDEPERMGSRLSHRGKTELKTGNTFSIGQLSTDPQVTPFHQNGISVISDARIDNRSEISEKCAFSEYEGMSTNEFIFMAYSKLGICFTELLVGDYSISIVDENRNKLFLIRDHMGVRPLYYCFKKGVCLAFASEPKALLSLDFVSRTLNPEKVQEYLQWPTDFRPYHKATFFQDIFSVIPATILEADMDLNNIAETFYWKIDPHRFRHLTTESLFIEEYKKRFETAVRRRLQTITGVHVSGGLDSSSVYKAAEQYINKEHLYSVHFYPGTSESDERAYAREVIGDNQKNHFQTERSLTPLIGIRQAQAYMDRPDHSTVPTGTKILPELIYFKNKGVMTVLTGHEGDTVVDSGVSYLLNLVVNLQLKKFEELIGGNCKSSKAKRLYFFKQALFYRYTTGGFAPALKLLGMIRAHKHISWIDFARITASCFIRFSEKWIGGRSSKSSGPSISVQYIPEALTGTVREHFGRIFSAGIIDINETLNLSGAAFGIEYAHPFLDKDFIELSLFMPDKMRVGPDGLARYHFRKAMEGILPEKVRVRQSKVRFDNPIRLMLIDTVNAFLRENDVDTDTKSKLIKIEKGLQTIDPLNHDFNKTRKFQRLLFLEIWKNQR